jgi:hypothetical protein
MMKVHRHLPFFCSLSVAFSLALLPALHAQIVGAPAAPSTPAATPSMKAPAGASAASSLTPDEADRAKAYFHAAMAGVDEEHHPSH